MPKNTPDPQNTLRTASSKKIKNLALHRAEHDPRAAALVALAKVLDSSQTSQEALDDVISSPIMMPTDKRLCTELVYGTLRHYTRLWWFAARCLPKPEKLPGEMQLTLVTALYEMTFLRIPHHASVGWAVSHIRNRFGVGLSKVCNGALRTMQRRLRDFHKPEFYAAHTKNEIECLALIHSCPIWIVQMWTQAYGEKETKNLLCQSLETPPSGLRINMQKPSWQELRQELADAPVVTKKVSKHLAKYTEQPSETADPKIPGMSNEAENSITAIQPENPQEDTVATTLIGEAGLLFAGALPWQARGLEQQGRASRQSMGSYAALMYFAPRSFSLPIWDACAGRGGKTIALLEMGIPVALATDTSEVRLKGLGKEYLRLGLTTPPCPTLILGSATDLGNPGSTVLQSEQVIEQQKTSNLNVPESFATILIDAPCSGLGTLARHPEIKYRRKQKDVEQLLHIQAGILAHAAQKLLPGGVIIYLTCTLNPAENQEQITTFLAQHDNFTLIDSFEGNSSSPFREFFYGAKLQKRA